LNLLPINLNLYIDSKWSKKFNNSEYVKKNLHYIVNIKIITQLQFLMLIQLQHTVWEASIMYSFIISFFEYFIRLKVVWSA